MEWVIAWCLDNWMLIFLGSLVGLELLVTKAWRSYKFPPTLNLPWRRW